MREIIDRVIWAVCPILRAADECDMPQIINGPRPECRECPASERGGGTAGCRVVAELVARAAIEVMREPTKAMLRAGVKYIDFDDRVDGHMELDEVSKAWQRMIDAALADKP